MSINTKEQLKSHIHKIHNLIRNSGAGYGLDALKIFNFFYGLKVLELFWDEYELESARFSQLVEMAKKADTPEKELRIHDELFGNNLSKGDKKYKQGCLYELNDNNELRKILVTKINEALKTNFYKQIILEINKIPTVNNKQKTDIVGDKFDVDIKGKTYEYFIGRDKQAISDLGAYFSDRHFTNFAINIVKPELVDDKVPMYIDPFGGSGGFTISFVNYIKSKYPKLDWDDDSNIDSINHYDMSEVVVKSCALEIFALTGKIPDMKEAFQIGNSFKADFGGFKYKYIFSNPPFGGSVSIDTSSESHKLIDELKNRFYGRVEGDKGKEVYRWTEDWAESQYKELKDKLDYEISEIKEQQVNWDTCGKRIREYCNKYDEDIDKKCRKEASKDYKQLIKTFQIKDKCNDKEACSLVMFMELLDKDGVAAIIIKEGVLFDSKYSSIRKSLVDNFNITHIISIPQDAFENTTTKTSIVIFKNNGRTEKIRFSELVVEKESEDIFEVITNGEGETRLELTAHRDQIKKVSDEVKAWATYGEISKSTLKSTGKSSKVMWNYSLNYKDYLKDETYCPEGYKLVKLGDICKISNGERIVKKDCKEGNIPVYGGGDISFYTDKYNRDGNTIIISRFAMSKKCVRIIKGKIFLNDSAISLSCEDNNMEIYIGNYLENNMGRVIHCSNASVQKNLDMNQFKNLLIPIPNDITKLKPILTKLAKTHSKISDLTEQIPQKESAICGLISELTSNGEEGKDWDEYKLGDEKMFKIEYGTRITKTKNKGTKYPVYGGGDISFYTDEEPNRTGETCVIGRFGLSDNCVRIIKGNIFLHDNALSITMNNNEYTNKQLMYYLLTIQKYICNECTNKTIQRALIMDKFKNIKIKILKDKVLTKHKLQDKFDEVNKMKEELEETKKTYQEDIKKLMEPFKQEVMGDEEDDNSSSKSTKSDKSSTPEKKVSRTRKQIESESDTESDAESKSDSDDEEAQLEKLGISKSDLVRFKKLSKDGCSHWFHYPTEKIFSNNREGKWVEGKTQLYNGYADEIEEFKEAKEKQKKSTKSSKSKKVKETKEKKNKSTKSNIVVDNSDTDDDKKIISQGQNVLKYKSKAKSNSKYVSDSDEDTDLDELERELEGKK